MSRVQKGGAIFKPITKVRPRQAPGAASRQASLVLDASTEPAAGPSTALPNPQLLSPPPPLNTGAATIPSSSQPPPLVSTVVQPALVPPPSAREQGPHALTPSTSKSTSQSNGQQVAAPLRQSGTPISIGVPRPPSQRPSTAASIISSPTNPPPLPPGVPATASNSTASEPALPQGPRTGPLTQVGENELAQKKRGSRKRKQSMPATDEGEGDGSPTSSKGKGRTPRSRAPSLPPYDPAVDPGEELDPTIVTMASLCSDTGQGRVSSKAIEVLSNHSIWKKQSREKRARMRALMEAKKYGKTEEEIDALEDENGVVPTPSSIAPSTSNATTATTTTDAGADSSNPDLDYSQDFTASRFNAQIRIGPNGETIIDEDSLVVNREETDETAHYTHVTESDTSKFVNSGTYSKRFRGSRWSAEETELFYDALTQYGENYELIAYVMPGRDRKSCKNKFKAEDKKNPARINYCLNNRTAPDIALLSRMTGKDFSGPTPEIRAPVRPTISAAPVEAPAEATHEMAPAPKRRRTKANDDGLLIVGDASITIPDFDS